jgi:hypothetical protein
MFEHVARVQGEDHEVLVGELPMVGFLSLPLLDTASVRCLVQQLHAIRFPNVQCQYRRHIKSRRSHIDKALVHTVSVCTDNRMRQH